LKGFVIGLANIIPGVSGGTMALVLGIYERVIRALRNVGWPLAAATLGALSGRREARGRLVEALRAVDAAFVALLGLGAVLAIVATSHVMEYLLREQHAAAYGFFFGLVLVSMVFPYRALRRRSWREAVALIVAAALTMALTGMVDEDRQIEKARAKQELEAGQAARVGETDDGEPSLVSFAHPGLKRLAFLFLASGLAISAMVLPGISGSFVLLMMGAYFEVLQAVNERQVVVLGVFAAGLVLGLLVFARIMNGLLLRAYNVTMAFMIGLMAGSLQALWPFKRVVDVGSERLYLGNLWPSWGVETARAAGAAALGAAIVAVFYVVERRKPAPAGGVLP
jgi:putative membrane protein